MQLLTYALLVSAVLLCTSSFNFWFFSRFKGYRCAFITPEPGSERLTLPALFMALIALILLLLAVLHAATTMYFERKSKLGPKALRNLSIVEKSFGMFIKVAPLCAPFALGLFLLILAVQAFAFVIDLPCWGVIDEVRPRSSLKFVMPPALGVNMCFWLILTVLLPCCRLSVPRRYFAWRPPVHGGSSLLNFMRCFSLF